MNFNSGAFLIFLPVVVLVYWFLPARFRWVWLLSASYFFYMYWNPALVVLLLLTTAVSYSSALAMMRWPRLKRALLVLTLLVCLGVLIYFKYANFLLQSVLHVVNGAAGGEWSFTIDVLLPVGISFYTFQTLSYVIDVYRGDFPAERHFGYYALFVVFFPQLVAGPIENPRNLLPQLRREGRWDREDFRAGGRLLLCGFFRKCVVADTCGVFVNRVFASPEAANGLAILCAGALFCLQMYNDFAGYSEIAAGSARLMGIRLTRNFDRPYLSQSYTEFFRRWHISLNQWFTQYVYIPLGGSRKGLGRKLLNTVIVFSLCGLWHGAKWTYLLWGLYAAFWVCLESLLKRPARRMAEHRNIDLADPVVKLVRRMGAFAVFIPAALLFRADGVGQAGVLLGRLFTAWSFAGGQIADCFALLQMGGLELLFLALCIVTMSRLSLWGQYDLPRAPPPDASARRTAAAACLVTAVALCWLSLLATQDAAGFAYFQF